MSPYILTGDFVCRVSWARSRGCSTSAILLRMDTPAIVPDWCKDLSVSNVICWYQSCTAHITSTTNNIVAVWPLRCLTPALPVSAFE